AIADIGDSIEHENPHAQEMPLQTVLRPHPNCEILGEMQPAENDFVIVYFPAAADHDENGNRIDPMHEPQRKRMQLAGC
ncbi:MAG: hypothetical protein WAM12_01815, partial [Pseudolabrys sp.]